MDTTKDKPEDELRAKAYEEFAKNALRSYLLACRNFLTVSSSEAQEHNQAFEFAAAVQAAAVMDSINPYEPKTREAIDAYARMQAAHRELLGAGNMWLDVNKTETGED